MLASSSASLLCAGTSIQTALEVPSGALYFNRLPQEISRFLFTSRCSEADRDEVA